MAIYSGGTSIGNAGTVLGSAANLTSVPVGAPSGSNVVGSTATFYVDGPDLAHDHNETYAGTLNYCNFSAQQSGSGSGTWRCHGRTTGDGNTQRITLWHRIS